MLLRPAEIPWPHLRVVRGWDLASTKPTAKNRDPDWTAGVLLGEADAEWYVLEARRLRDNVAGIEKLLVATMHYDDAWLHRPVPIRVEQEGGASGAFNIEGFRVRLFLGRDFDGIRPTVSKADRARPVAIAAEKGYVHLLDGPWVDDFLDELEIFPPSPGEGHDDQVDALSLAWWALTGGGLQVVHGVKPQADERDNPFAVT